MLVPYTRYGFIDEHIIRQTLNKLMHPKHWGSWRCEDLSNLVLGWPARYEPKTENERANYQSKNLIPKSPEEAEAAWTKAMERRRKIDESGKEDPDHLLRVAADAGAYISVLSGSAGCYGCFTGELAADMTVFDIEKDKNERKKLWSYLRTVCRCGSRALFSRLTSSDKAQIDSLLGPGYSDLPGPMETPLNSTGAQDFDKKFPAPPLEYRLDACEMIPYIHEYLIQNLQFRENSNALTPGGAAVLTAALSAVLYKAYQHYLDKKKEENEEEKKEKGKTGESKEE